MSSESGFNFYCYGEVAANKPEDTNIIEVFPKELMYDLNGEISNTSENVTINRTSADGKVKVDKASAKNTIPARWLGLGGSNRVSSPDVRKGETVLVFRYGTNDDYYWEPITTETTKRGKETVTYLFKNTDSQDEVNENNSYFLTYSTRHKFVHLHTSKNDGEPVAFDIKLNTKKGIFTLTDSRGNLIDLKSVEDYLKFKTNKKIDLETNECNIIAKTKLTITTPDMLVDAKTYLQKDSSYTLTTTAFNMTSASGSMTASNSEGFNFTNKLIATDLKTNVLNSINTHRHPGDSGGTTQGPIN